MIELIPDDDVHCFDVETIDGVEFRRNRADRDIPLWRIQPLRLRIETWHHPGRKTERPLHLELTLPVFDPERDAEFYWDILQGHDFIELSWTTKSEPFAIDQSPTRCVAKCILAGDHIVWTAHGKMERVMSWRLFGWAVKK